MKQLYYSPFHLACLCVFLFFVVPNTNFVCAQSEEDANAKTVHALIGTGGMGRYELGRWSVLSVNAFNATSEEADATLSVYLESNSRMQFTRHLWIPARASRTTWLPIRTPDNIRHGQTALHVSTLNVIGSGTDAVLRRSAGEQLITESLLPLDPVEPHVGMISPLITAGQPYTTAQRDNEAYEAVIEVREMHGNNRMIVGLGGRYLPPHPEAYEALDQLVICTDRFTADSGSIAAIRTWIARGGRAWIMLDLVGIDAIRALLGNACPCEIVDRVELTEFTIETPESFTVGAKPRETWVAEEPVEFVRVLADSVDTYSSIDGWPAAFSIPFGNGQVLITTLAARGWRHQHDLFADDFDPNRPTSGPTGALRYLASNFTEPVSNGLKLTDDMKPILSEQLGYRVPSRGIAALVLGLNCAVIVIAGIWLTRREKLERIAFVIPAATAVAALVLVMIGSANTSSIPATSSILRLADVSSEANEIHAESLVAFYSPDTINLPLAIDVSGVVSPELQDLAGVAKRATWDDDGRGRWEQVDIASGSVRFARASENQVLEHPLRARCIFGPDGLEGRIVGVEQLGTPSDALVTSPPAPNSGITIDKKGVFRIRADDILSDTQFLKGTLLSDEQQRRQSVYRQILTPEHGKVYPQRPTLFVWGDSRSLGLTAPELFQQSGSTLYAVPLDIGRTPSKQPFLIPSTFIRMTNARAKHGASAAYNPRTGRWMKNALAPTQSYFQFLLPRAVLPCKIQNTLIKLKIHAPSRTVELTGLKNGAPVTIKRLKSPSGVLTFSIDDPEVLDVSEDGGLHFGVTISPTEAQAAKAAQQAQPQVHSDGDKPDESFDNSTWQIDYLHLQASGETL